MLPSWPILVAFFLSVSLPGVAFGQEEITVNATQPCFLNLTAGYHLLENCNADGDYLKWVLAPWEWISGGFFTGIIVAVLVLGSYMQFKKAIYPVVLGISSIPFAFYFFPESFVSFAGIMAFVAIGMMLIFILVRQTRQ